MSDLNGRPDPKGPAEPVRERAVCTIREHGMLRPGDSVLVAVSGGADSVCLLHLLLSLKEPLSLREVAALHVHHGLRGEEADRDERLVRALCREWAVPLTVHRVQVAQEAAQAGEGLEEAGRRVRYRLLEEQASCLPAPCRIATAHTLSDSAETLLLHLARGCGLAGLTGIPPVRGRIIRPLIDCTREEIEEYCQVHALSYVQDSTNADIAFARNRIRRRVLPQLREVNPAVEQALARLMRLAKRDESCLEEQASRAMEDARLPGPHPPAYAVAALRSLPEAILCRVLRKAACEAGAIPEERHVAAMCALLGKEGVCALPGGVEAVLRRGRLTFSREPKEAQPPFSVPVEPGGDYTFGDTRYHCRLLSRADFAASQKIYKNLLHFSLCYDILNGSLVARQRLPGDRYHPVHRGGKTLKSLCQEAGLTPQQRAALPVVCDRQGIVLVPGFGCDERVRLTESSEQILLFFPEIDGGQPLK